MKLRRLNVLACLVVFAVEACATGGDPVASTNEAIQASPGRADNIYFNHTYGLITPATISAFQNNAYLHDHFVDVEIRTTVRTDITYTGTYLNMRDTYLEWFPAGTLGLPLGRAAIGLGDESPGGAARVAQLWDAEFGSDQVDIETITHEINGAQVPWFLQTQPMWRAYSYYTDVWEMEYFADNSSDRPRTRREERAARYNPSLLAQNVDAVSYGIIDGDRDNLRRTLSSVGLDVTPSGSGFTALTPIDYGTRREIHVEAASPGRTGILWILIRLNGVETHTEQLGDAVLQVGLHGRPYAVLSFTPLTADDQAQIDALVGP